jgi:hypothetical protein
MEVTLLTFTWMSWREGSAPDAITVIWPLDPGDAVIFITPFPVPVAGATVMFGWFERAVQLRPLLPLKLIATVCGLVIAESL